MHFITALATSLTLFNAAFGSEIAEVISKRQGVERVVQIVNVGDNNGSLKFFPEKIVAEVGSIVQFQFYPKNHTITESSFAAPCVPIASNLTTPERPGQKSGFVPVSADTTFRPVYNLIVNDTKPMWIFCGQQPHCARGMAMVINQNMSSPDKTLEKYKEAAAKLAPAAPPAGSPSAPPSPPVPPTGAATSAAAISTTTATSIAASNSGGPALSGTTTSSSPIQTFSGAAEKQIAPAAGMLGLLAAGLVLL